MIGITHILSDALAQNVCQRTYVDIKMLHNKPNKGQEMESLEEKQLKILKEMSKQLAVNCSEYLAAGIDSLALDYAQKYDALVGAIQALEEKE